MESVTSGWVYFTLNSLAVIFVLTFGLVILTLVVFYIIDITQTKHAVRRNLSLIHI